MRSAGGSRAAPDLLQFAMSRVLKETLNFDAVVTSPARSARPSAPRSRTAAGAAETCAARCAGARRCAVRDGVDATRGRRRRRRAQIVSSGAVQGEERERRRELVGKSHLWRSRLPAWYAHRFAPRLLVRSTMGWGCAVRDARSCSALLRAYLLASFESVLLCPSLREIHVVTLFFAGEFSHASRERVISACTRRLAASSATATRARSAADTCGTSVVSRVD